MAFPAIAGIRKRSTRCRSTWGVGGKSGAGNVQKVLRNKDLRSLPRNDG